MSREIQRGATHCGAIEYLLSVARSRDGRETVSEIEMEVVHDVLKAICFVIASNENYLHLHDKYSLHILLSYKWNCSGMPEIEDEIYRKHSSSFPSWMRYIDGRAEQEIFIFLFIGYYESIEHFPEYSDAALRPYFNSLLEKLCTENPSGVNYFAAPSSPLLNLPPLYLSRALKYFMNREISLEQSLSRSEAEVKSLNGKLRDASCKLFELQLRRLGTPDREYRVRESDGPYHVSVYDSIGKVQKYKDVESCVCEVIAEKLVISQEEVTLESNLTELGADSLDSVDVIMELELILRINIPDDETADISTVGDVVTLVRALLLQDRPCGVETYDIEALDELLGESYERI